MTAEEAAQLAVQHRQAGRMEEAVAACRQALVLFPQSVALHNELAMALAALGRHAEAFYHLGTSLGEEDRIDDADAAFQHAIALKPQYPEAHVGASYVRWRAGRVEEALEQLRTAIRLRPQSSLHSTLLFNMQFSPRETAESIFLEHRRFNDLYAEPLRSQIRPHANDRDPDRRLRIGCVSGDFRNHVQALFTIPLFAAHDRGQVELYCYSNAPSADKVSDRIRGMVDGWRDTARATDEQVAELVHQDAIDILVDHNMHMTYARPLIFARKPAPVQVAWLAYPGTTGMTAMDYRLTDPYLDPPGTEAGKYSEASIHLESFWCYDPMRTDAVGEPPVLHNGCVTFGCLNNFAKVNDGVLSLWSRVLAAVPGSRLLMQAPAGSSRQRVLDKLAAAGVDASRAEFVGILPRPEYLRTYRRIDITLDTFPYNGHTTSMDSLWMGAPVVTLIGQTVAGRAGWSQLNNLQLPDLAANDEAQFIRIAADLAADVPRLRELRATLRERMRASPLIDAKRFARSMEAAFRTMWRRWCLEGDRASESPLGG